MKPAGLVVVVALGVAMASFPAGARSCGPQRGTVGAYDFFLLSLSWSPGFCATPAGRNVPEQCATSQSFGFVVHGLWPQRSDGSWPQCCGGEPYRPDSVPDRLDGVMVGDQLRRHEWEKHGACATRRADDYFAMIARAVETVGMAETVRTSAGGKIRISDLKRHWPVPAAAVVPRCKGKNLSEVRLCLDRALAPIPCPETVRDDDNCPGTVTLPGQ